MLPSLKAVIAWDGSFSAGRAFRDFVGFAAPYDLEITVLTAGLDPQQGEVLLREAGSYLEASGVTKFDTVYAETTSVGEIHDEYLADADVIAAGIHARRFFKDLFVGSFTNRLIEIADTTLFLSH